MRSSQQLHLCCVASPGASAAGHHRQQDAFAIESYRRAAAAARDGSFQWEMAPVPVKGRGGGAATTTVSVDEEVSKVDLGKLSSLRPVFKPAAEGGTITAANASSLSDGASALVLTSAARAKALGATPLAVIRGFADAEQAPIDFPTTPSKAVPIALQVSAAGGRGPAAPPRQSAALPPISQRAGLTLRDVDYHEVNEAFSVVALANAQRLGLLAVRGSSGWCCTPVSRLC